jgi:hypothetical protein
LLPSDAARMPPVTDHDTRHTGVRKSCTTALSQPLPSARSDQEMTWRGREGECGRKVGKDRGRVSVSRPR